MNSRWQDVAGDDSGADYAARFDALAADGKDVHGEAGLVERVAAPDARILDAGCGTGRVAIELAHRGFEVVGADIDASMLAIARQRGPDLTWYEADLASLDLGHHDFDVVVAAGNVLPLLAAGTEQAVVGALADHLVAGGLLVAGFGLDVAHLPLDEVPITIERYDQLCTAAGLTLETRLATWDGAPWDHGGYAVSIHRARGA